MCVCGCEEGVARRALGLGFGVQGVWCRVQDVIEREVDFDTVDAW